MEGLHQSNAGGRVEDCGGLDQRNGAVVRSHSCIAARSQREGETEGRTHREGQQQQQQQREQGNLTWASPTGSKR